MYKNTQTVPVVLCFSASDPSGGAGLQADIETLGLIGCHCAPVMTAVTVQDTTKFHYFSPCSSKLVMDQARAILEDMPVAGFKIGSLGSEGNIRAIHKILSDYPNLPVVLDPGMSHTRKNSMMTSGMQEAMMALLLPFATICLPNKYEAKALALEADTLEACAHEIMAHGADYVLITDCGNNPNKVSNAFFGNYRKLDTFDWPKLPNKFHGSGCTLSASIAGLLGQGLEPFSAVLQGQEYTAECLKHGYRVGLGQHLPNRLFWARETAFEYDATGSN